MGDNGGGVWVATVGWLSGMGQGRAELIFFGGGRGERDSSRGTSSKDFDWEEDL